MRKVQTIITSGKNIYSAAGFESGFRIYQARPDKLRVEGDYQGSKVIQTYDGKRGWVLAPAMGIPEAAELQGEELLTLLNQVIFESPLRQSLEDDTSIDLIPANGEGKEHQLVLTTPEGKQQHYFIDRETHLITTIRSNQLMGGAEKEMEVSMDRYRVIKGIPFAIEVSTRMDGQVVTTTRIEKVELNKKLDPSIFEMPVLE